MALRPTEKVDGVNRPRQLNENDKAKLRKEKAKSDYNRRNRKRK